MKTLNDLIKELQEIKPSLRKLPIVIVAPNGIEFDPKIKIQTRKGQILFDEPDKLIITW